MEVNKESAEQCLEIGAKALKNKDYARAIKFLKKSLALYPLPGAEALLASAERAASSSNGDASASASASASGSTSSSSTSFNHSSTRSAAAAGAAAASSSTTTSSGTGNDGRAYTQAQVEIVESILRAKEGGRGAHYRVLQLQQTCTEAEIKKSYRKMALKLHPDKNSAPKADEAFKAVGLAYATLSDPQKRTIYDRYGEEDPDNRGGGMRPGGGPGGVHFRPGQEVSPEEIFNMFFGGMGGPMGGRGGGMHRGPGGMHFYTNFGGPGGMGGFPQQRRRRAAAGGGGQGQQQEDPNPGIATLMQLLPFMIIMLLSFMNMSDTNTQGGVNTSKGKSQGLDRYFSLTQKDPFVNPLQTRLTKVKDIPYWVDTPMYRRVNRDRYQLAQVERMVENAYENYLVEECNVQRKYKKSLIEDADKKPTPEEQEIAKKTAREFELSRCVELNDLFPIHHTKRKR
mmetsp:Transcript_41267/g.98803  ORF Transcript_41267/g.98803 Transcript_41267/m.98803 type:complete len:456 (+) Transcript_41267:408-1775(+)